MNVLLMGDPNSVFIRDFCANVLGGDEFNTTILTQHKAINYKKDYQDHQIKVVLWPDLFLKGIRSQLRALTSIIKVWNRLGREIGFDDQIDVLHVHYFEPLHLLYFFPFWRKAKRKILTFWGSDLLCASHYKLKLFPYFLKHATSIVFMIPNQYDCFCKNFGHKYDSKIHIIDFGNSQIDEIDCVNKKYGEEECKRHFGFPTDKYVVHIGYNACKEQQHVELIKNIAMLPQELLTKMKFVLHMSYGKSTDFEMYKKCLTEMMDAFKMDYSIIEDYLQGEELAMFRRTCNIFLYGQKTDARSASPLEYVYAGAVFICPVWLATNYKLFDKGNIKYYVYNRFEDLDKIMQQSLKELENPGEIISAFGREAIRKEKSWNSLSKEWRSLYE